MRLLVYNIRYGTGGKRRPPWSGYFTKTGGTTRQITEFIKPLDPDVVGLLEVDEGSYRSDRQNQAETIASELGHYHVYESKYAASSFAQVMPLLSKQGNAFLTRDTITNAQFHYFDRGLKRLVIELELENMVVFLVHLALRSSIRHRQLGDLYSLVNGTGKPHIVAGDFNARWGDREIGLFRAATNLRSACPDGLATYPSWDPKRQLDFILCSDGIDVNRFDVPPVRFSDHLPLVCDFELK